MSKRRPLLIIVSGAPGSGKTTLARMLADHMRILHIERDGVIRGLEFTQQEPLEWTTIGFNNYYSLLADTLHRGVSLITDSTLHQGVSEQEILEKLAPFAHIVNVHVRANTPEQRFYDREMNRPNASPDWVKQHMSHLDEIRPLVTDPLQLNATIIEVNSSGDYTPSISEVVAAVEHDYAEEGGKNE